MEDVKKCLFCDGPLNKGKKFCSKSCSNKHGHAKGTRNANAIKGMNMSLAFLVERYGDEEGTKRHEEFIKTMSIVTSGERNPMYGRNDQIKKAHEWCRARKGKSDAEMYGPERAAQISSKKSHPGERNPMYGKPAPKLSGKGTKGYYKGCYFRSLLELTCMMHYEREGIPLEKMRHEPFLIPYKDAETQRTYRPDFLIEELGLLIEAKPIKLVKTRSNLMKFEAAENFCSQNGLTFLIFTELSTTITKSEAASNSDVVLL